MSLTPVYCMCGGQWSIEILIVDHKQPLQGKGQLMLSDSSTFIFCSFQQFLPSLLALHSLSALSNKNGSSYTAEVQ